MTGTKSLRGTTLVEAPRPATPTLTHDSGCGPSTVTCRSPRLLPGEFGCPWLRPSAPCLPRHQAPPAMPGFHRHPALCDGFGQPTAPVQRTKMVDLRGFEPLTSSMPLRRAPNCATGPRSCGGPGTAAGLFSRRHFTTLRLACQGDGDGIDQPSLNAPETRGTPTANRSRQRAPRPCHLPKPERGGYRATQAVASHAIRRERYAS